VTARTESSEQEVTVGADGFSYTRADGDGKDFKVGTQL
jgi:catechol 2,3-dioxygenase